MKKRIYKLTQPLRDAFKQFCLRKAVFYFTTLIGMVNTAWAQEGHEHDTLRVLGRNDFSAVVLQVTGNQAQVQVVSNIGDTLMPAFVEVSVNGFLFSNDCVLQQKLNSTSIVSNIEKIWGPEFVSLGIGELPPGARYTADLGVSANIPPGSVIRIRVFGSIKGQDILWTTTIRK